MMMMQAIEMHNELVKKYCNESYYKLALDELHYQGEVLSLTVPSTFIKHGSVSYQIKELAISLDDLAKVVE